MKNLKFILPIIVLLILSSCKKEVVEPDLGPNRVPYPEFESGYDINNQSFVLISGTLFMENMNTGEKVQYDHFDDTKKVSGMLAGNFDYDIEKLEVNVTTWSFMSRGVLELWIDSDSLNPYGIQQSSYGDRIIEHINSTTDGPITMKMGGSSKPYTIGVTDEDEDIITIYINEAYIVIDGVQYTYFNELDFQLIK